MGNLLDLLLWENGNENIIVEEVYSLLFYSVILIFPRMIYRTLYFMEARNPIILRKKKKERFWRICQKKYCPSENF